MAVQTINTYKGYEVRVKIYIKGDGSGDAPTNWDITSGNGVNLIGVATSVEASASSEVTDVTGLNQQVPYNTKAGNVGFEWSMNQLYTKTNWTDDAGEPNTYNPLNMITSGKRFAMQIEGLDGSGETADVGTDITIVLTQCTVGEDGISVDGSDGDWELSMSGRAANRVAALVT